MYTIIFHEDIEKDFKEVGNNVVKLVLKKLTKIAKNPLIGAELGNKANNNLAGLRKTYVDNKRIRIVYKIIDDKIELLVVAVGKRDNMEVYKVASKRL